MLSLVTAAQPPHRAALATAEAVEHAPPGRPTRKQRGFLQDVRAYAKRRAHHLKSAALPLIGKSPKADSFTRVRHEEKALRAARTFDLAAASALRDRSRRYLDATRDTVARKPHRAAKREAVERLLARLDGSRQLDIDERHCMAGDAPGSELTSLREPHAHEMLDPWPAAGRASTALSTDGKVRGLDGFARYRFVARGPRGSQHGDGRQPLHAVFACAVNQRLRREAGLDLGVPIATVAKIEGRAGVLLDADDGLDDPCAPGTSTLQRLALGNWLLGRPYQDFERLSGADTVGCA